MDFYAPKAKTAVEVNGSQHRRSSGRPRFTDETHLASERTAILRFDSLQVLTAIEVTVGGLGVAGEIPLNPLFPKGEDRRPAFYGAKQFLLPLR